MLPDVFSRPMAEGCLNAWQVSRLAMGFPEVNATAHLESCAGCAGRVREEEQEINVEHYKPVPKAVRTRRGPRMPAPWHRLLALVPIAAMAGILCVSALRPEADVRIKGTTAALSLAVQRGGKVIVNDAPVEEVAHLQPGDRVRLRVRNAEAVRAMVEGFENDSGVSYYDGVVAEDGWLPVGITLTNVGQTKLRVTLCDATGRCDATRVLSY